MNKCNSLYNLAFNHDESYQRVENLSQSNLKDIYPEIFLQVTTPSRRKRLFGKGRKSADAQMAFSEAAYLAAAQKHSESIEEGYFRSPWYRRLRIASQKMARRMFINQRAINEDIALVLKSDFFDAGWYAKVNCLTGSQEELARHYLLFGFANLMDPSPSFSTKAYLQSNQDILFSSINPLVHYLRHGISEKRKIAASSQKTAPK